MVISHDDDDHNNDDDDDDDYDDDDENDTAVGSDWAKVNLIMFQRGA